MTAHTDFDYDSLPVPDFSSGRRVVLVKSHPTDSPTQEHRWPLINDALNAVLAEDHPAAFEQICELVDDIVAAHRGWSPPPPRQPRHSPSPHQLRPQPQNHQPEK